MPFDRNIFKLLAPKTPARVASNIEDANYMRRFFNTVQGIGCRIDAPRDDGRGWRIIVDGTSDEDVSEGGTNDYENIFQKTVRTSFPARIDGNATDSSYTFTELVPSAGVASGWADRQSAGADFRTGTAWEINGNTTLVIGGSAGSQLRVTMHESPEGIYWFDLPIPYMNQYQVVTALEDGEPQVTYPRVTSS